MANRKTDAKVKKSPKLPPKVKVTIVPHKGKKITRAQVFSFTGDDGKKYSLTLQQKFFCELFCEFSMNGVTAIIEAGYNVYIKDKNGDDTPKINYKLAAHMAHENLLKPNISAYITTLLDRYGLSDDNAEKQLLAVMNQNAELSAKTRAIDIYYKKKGAYAPDKHNIGISDELEKALDRIAQIVPKAGA